MRVSDMVEHDVPSLAKEVKRTPAIANVHRIIQFIKGKRTTRGLDV